MNCQLVDPMLHAVKVHLTNQFTEFIPHLVLHFCSLEPPSVLYMMVRKAIPKTDLLDQILTSCSLLLICTILSIDAIYNMMVIKFNASLVKYV